MTKPRIFSSCHRRNKLTHIIKTTSTWQSLIYNREMFSSGKQNLGKGISSLAGLADEHRKTEGSGYAEDYSAVFEYNNLLKQLKE